MEDLPLLVVKNRKTTFTTGVTRFAKVNKPQRNRIIKLGKITRLLPSPIQTKKVKLTVSDEILDKMASACEGADVKQTEVEAGVVTDERSISLTS